MKLKRKWIILIIVVFIIFCGAAGFLYLVFGPGITKEQTAQILVNDFKFGGRAKQKAIRDGDAILPLIKKESEDFKKLDNRNSYWISEVLGKIKTNQSRAILRDLYSRPNKIARLTGAIGLAEQGIFPDRIDEESFLVKTVHSDPDQTETQLAIIALGKTKDPRALPCLLDILKKRPIDYWHHAYACEAVARIHSQTAIPVLRDCLKSDQFYALPEAFRALITLSDREAIPLAIARVSPEIKGYNSGFLVGELKKVTGKNYGYDRKEWEKWWEKAKSDWQVPEKFLKPWDKQPANY